MSEIAYLIDGPANGQRFAVHPGMCELRMQEHFGRYVPIAESVQPVPGGPSTIEHVYEKVTSPRGAMSNAPDIDHVFIHNKMRLKINFP